MYFVANVASLKSEDILNELLQVYGSIILVYLLASYPLSKKLRLELSSGHPVFVIDLYQCLALFVQVCTKARNSYIIEIKIAIDKQSV